METPKESYSAKITKGYRLQKNISIILFGLNATAGHALANNALFVRWADSVTRITGDGPKQTLN